MNHNSGIALFLKKIGYNDSIMLMVFWIIIILDVF